MRARALLVELRPESGCGEACALERLCIVCGGGECGALADSCPAAVAPEISSPMDGWPSSQGAVTGLGCVSRGSRPPPRRVSVPFCCAVWISGRWLSTTGPCRVCGPVASLYLCSFVAVRWLVWIARAVIVERRRRSTPPLVHARASKTRLAVSLTRPSTQSNARSPH